MVQKEVICYNNREYRDLSVESVLNGTINDSRTAVFSIPQDKKDGKEWKKDTQSSRATR